MQLQLEIGTVEFERAVLVTEDGERRLRPLELRLLGHLCTDPDRVHSAESLLREVWGYVDGVETRTLYATINRLRLAIERDPTQPTHILTVARQGYRFVPSSPAVPTQPSTLPPVPYRLIGREEDLDKLTQRITEHRLTTLRGPAGVGKTRLALELAHTRWAGRVIWCDLAEAASPAELFQVLGSALSQSPLPEDAVAALSAVLARIPAALVVLDNADRVDGGVRDLLQAWSMRGEVDVLVTSRSALGVDGEVQHALTPLDSGTGDGFSAAPEGTQPRKSGVCFPDSATLLEDRVRDRMPDFRLPLEQPWVTPLLEILGGIPLALELAAPWLTVLTGPELLGHVQEGLTSLQRAGPDRRGRHGSLEASLRWSWPLLTPVEQATLQQCTVFRGGFDLRAANAVIDLSEWPDSGPVHEVFFGLVERSWLRVQARSYGQVFSLYSGHREFIATEGEHATIEPARHRHTAHHVEIGAGVNVGTRVRGGAFWERLQATVGDAMAAFERAEGADRGAIACSLGLVLLATGPLQYGLDTLERALDESLALDQQLPLQRHRAVALRCLGRVPEAREVLTTALARTPNHEAYRVERARTQHNLGVLERVHGSLERSAHYLERSLENYQHSNSPLERAVVLAEIGTLRFVEGDLGEAAELLERALAPLREAGESWVYAIYLGNLAAVELVADYLESAARHLQQALVLHRRFGSIRYEALALANLALVEERRQNWVVALAHVQAGLALAEQAGDREQQGNLWSNRGLIYLGQARLNDAADSLDRAKGIATELCLPRLSTEVMTRRARSGLHGLGRVRARPRAARDRRHLEHRTEPGERTDRGGTGPCRALGHPPRSGSSSTRPRRPRARSRWAKGTRPRAVGGPHRRPEGLLKTTRMDGCPHARSPRPVLLSFHAGPLGHRPRAS